MYELQRKQNNCWITDKKAFNYEELHEASLKYDDSIEWQIVKIYRYHSGLEIDEINFLNKR